jgi:hypothetical protein
MGYDKGSPHAVPENPVLVPAGVHRRGLHHQQLERRPDPALGRADRGREPAAAALRDYNHAIRWRLRQRLSTCERELLDLRTPRPEPVAFVPAEAPATIAPTGAPTATPPGSLL